MRTITCKKLGSVVSITVGNVYAIIAETEDRYTIVNDKGVQANYGKNLFNDPIDVPEQDNPAFGPGNAAPRRGVGRPRRPRAEQAAAARVIPTIDAIEVHTSAEQEQNMINFKVKFMFMEGFTFEHPIRNQVSSNGITASCGIQSLSGLNDLNRSISMMRDAFMQYVRDHQADFALSRDIDIDNLFEEIPVALIQDLVASYQGDDAEVKAGILILSTTVEDIRPYPATRRALDRIDPNNIAVHNPNSGNEIIMWNVAVNA